MTHCAGSSAMWTEAGPAAIQMVGMMVPPGLSITLLTLQVIDGFVGTRWATP
jgi:hypothetical protein